MPEHQTEPYLTVALSTKVEEDFVAPLTALRGSLEILRDVPDLADDERQRFVETALKGCSRLETAVAELAETAYAAGKKALAAKPASSSSATQQRYAKRITVHDDMQVLELDFSDFEFSDSKIVDAFYDEIEQHIEASGRDWYFLVNFRNCRVWPEAWIAFAHRGKKISVNSALGTVRYAEDPEAAQTDAEQDGSSSFNPDMCTSRSSALAKINKMKDAPSN